MTDDRTPKRPRLRPESWLLGALGSACILTLLWLAGSREHVDLDVQVTLSVLGLALLGFPVADLVSLIRGRGGPS